MPLQLKAPPKNICLLRLSAIGDVTHVVPVVRNLQRMWPEIEITWIIGKAEYSLLKGLGGVEFIIFEKNKGLSAYRDLRKKLKGRKFDVLLHMQVSLRASLASLLVRAPIRVGFDKARAKNAQWLFTNHRIAETPRQHVLEGFLEFARILGISDTTIEWNIPIPAEDRIKTSHWVDENCSFLVINPSSSMRIRNWRNWDAQAYAEVADYASENYNLLTVLTGGTSSEEKEFAAKIDKLIKSRTINLVGKTSLKQLLALLEKAVFVISPDTGPAHMANAVGTPVIGLYASSNPERTGPYNFSGLTVNCYPEAVRKVLQKSVQEVPWGKRVRDPQIMNLIQVEHVKKRIDQVVQGKNP